MKRPPPSTVERARYVAACDALDAIDRLWTLDASPDDVRAALLARVEALAPLDPAHTLAEMRAAIAAAPAAVLGRKLDPRARARIERNGGDHADPREIGPRDHARAITLLGRDAPAALATMGAAADAADVAALCQWSAVRSADGAIHVRPGALQTAGEVAQRARLLRFELGGDLAPVTVPRTRLRAALAAARRRAGRGREPSVRFERVQGETLLVLAWSTGRIRLLTPIGERNAVDALSIVVVPCVPAVPSHVVAAA